MNRQLLKLFFMMSFMMSYSQKGIKIGSGYLQKNENVNYFAKSRSTLSKENKITYVILEFKKLPTIQEKKKLQANGIQLLSYVQDKLYYALLNKEKYKRKNMKLYSGVSSVYNVDPLWKIASSVNVDKIPEYALESEGVAMFDIQYFKSIKGVEAENGLISIGAKIISHEKEFNTIRVAFNALEVKKIASVPFVKWIQYINPPNEFENIQGRTLSRANVLNSNKYWGKGLLGEGIVTGVWDGSIEYHPDLGSRLKSMEFEYDSSHGQHVSGTMAGAGIMDPRGRGMAPKVEVLAWNFNRQSNGLNSQQEMLQSVKKYNMSITQNSYGVPMSKRSCESPNSYGNSDYQLDELVNKYSNLTHVFSVGNDQAKCTPYTGSRYYTSTKRAKNPIFVGAIDENGKMSDFSSWGPTDDGRLIPHISAFGVDVYSTVYGNKYEGGSVWSGTSMSSPVVSGVMALLYEQYKKLFGEEPIASLAKAAVLNTATDKGNIGPDYQYGYGVLNGVKAIELLEKKQFFRGDISQSEKKEHIINVPFGTKELKVMMVWTDKAGQANNKALINDLDITLEKGGNRYLPWVLDPLKPSLKATKGLDRLNNQEQIIVKEPTSGTYLVKVNGYNIPEGIQEYSLVYDFVVDDLSMVYPNGEEKWSPGSEQVIMWSSTGYSGSQSLELSLDNGRSYSLIADNIPAGTDTYNFIVPEEITNLALVRVIQDGVIGKSTSTFTIMKTPENLKISDQNDCGENGILIWDNVEGASKYKILKANVNNGTFDVVDEVSENSYVLPKSNGDRVIFSVAAVSDNGIESERTYAVTVESSNSIDLSVIKLPFEENLAIYPSKHLKVSKGKGVNIKYTKSLFSNEMAHTIVMNGNDVTEAWANSKDHHIEYIEDIASVKLCDLETSSHSGDLWLRVACVLKSTTKGKAIFRLVVDSEPVESSKGNIEIDQITKGENILYWNLTDYVGKNISLSFQSLLESSLDKISIGHFKIFKPQKDVGISFKAPKKFSKLANEEIIEVKIRNFSGEVVSNLPVSYQINGKTEVKEFVNESIAPMSSIIYKFKTKADFSEEDILYNIKTKVNLEGDIRSENNIASDLTIHYGDYHLMPIKNYGNEIIAKKIPKGFTDNGGKGVNYSNKIKGSVSIKPETKGKKAKIKFLEFNTEKAYDKVIIRDGLYSFSPELMTLSGDSLNLPLEFVSSGYSGGLYVQFESNSSENRAGWYAEVSEVDDPSKDPSNVFSVKYLSNYSGDYTIPKAVSVRINNQGVEDVENVEARYRINKGNWVNEVIPIIKANSGLNFKFKEKIIVTEIGKDFNLEVEVLDEDVFMKDNRVEKDIQNDYYCFSYSKRDILNKTLFFITNVSKGGVNNATSAKESPSSSPQYYRDVKFPFYQNLGKQYLKVNLSGTKSGGKIALWVDWNKNKDFKDDIPFYINTVVEKTEYNIPVVIPSGVNIGSYFARVRLTEGKEVDPCKPEYSNLGEIEDYSIEVLEEYPIKTDLALVGTNLKDGVNLSEKENISVTIENRGGVEVSNFDVVYQVNGGEVVKETVSQRIEPFGVLEYVFKSSFDFSKASYYNINFEVKKENDEDLDNNTFYKQILNQVPDKNGYYALNFDGDDDVLEVGTLSNQNLTSFTYEVWANPSNYGGYGGLIGFGRLFDGKNATIFLHGENNSNYPKHSLIIASLGGGTYFTGENTIDLNRWQHIAISFDDTSKELRVYIDGENVPLTIKSSAGEIVDNSNKKLYIGNRSDLNRAFKGGLDHVRVWKVSRSAAEISNNMHKTLFGDKDLLAEFKFDEGYFNKTTVSGEVIAKIKNADYSNSDNGIWKEPKLSFIDYGVEGHDLEFKKVSEKVIEIELKQSADLEKIVSNYLLNMSNVAVLVNNVEQVSGSTVNAFSDSENVPVEYFLEKEHLGKTLKTKVEVVIKNEANPEAELLTLEIPFLDIKIDSVNSDMSFGVDEYVNVSALKTKFSVTNGSAVYINNVEVKEQEIIWDFNKVLVIKVLSANKRDYKLYTISLKKNQTIIWETQDTSLVYGNSIFDLTAVSSSGEQVVYKSSDSEVLSVAHNRVTIKGAGEAVITAYHYGNFKYNPAVPVEKKFEVSKALLKIKADDKEMEYLGAVPELTVTYDGFVYNEDALVVDGVKVSTVANKDSLPGVYPISVSGGDAQNYKIEMIDGVLEIIDSSVYTITFNVTYKGNPLKGVTVQINDKTLITNEKGEVSLVVKDGYYDYMMTLKGKEDIIGAIDVKRTDRQVYAEMIDVLSSYSLMYSTDGNGYVEGEVSQKVKKGNDGTKVKAFANSGYEFYEWNDGVKENPRTDINVIDDVNVVAIFEKVYTLPYSQGFESANGITPPMDWKNISNNKTNQIWEFLNSGFFIGGEGNSAVLNSSDYGSSGSQDADLISPLFDFSDYKRINLSFVHYFQQFNRFNEVASLSYSIDGGENWNELERFESNKNDTEFNKEIDKVAGESRVRFKWHYEGYWGFWWMLDSIKIEEINTMDIVKVGDFVKNINRITVYPTLFTDNITINGVKTIKNIRLYDLSSNLLLSKNYNRNTVIVNLEFLKSGVYLLQVETMEGEQELIKLIKI